MLSVAALQKLERPRERNQIAALAVRETLLRMNVAKASPSVNIVTVTQHKQRRCQTTL